MKKFILLFVVALTASSSFVSCSKDDEASLIGKWAYYKEGGSVSGTEVLTDYVNDCTTKRNYIEFKSDGTATLHYFNSDCEESTYISTYVRNGNTITLDENDLATIMKLSGSTLKVKYDDTDYPEGYAITVFQKI